MRDFQQIGRSVTLSQNGMCATSHPLAAKVAVQMLEAGGNAVDAGIAAAMVLNICEPQMTGLGGDCFALLSPAPGQGFIGLNASGRAPAGLSAARLRAQGHSAIPDQSADAVTIPGAVDGFVTLSQDHGRLPLAEVLAPAIRYANEGIPVAPRVAFDWKIAEARLQGRARNRYLLNGKAPITGQVFAAPDQARVLEKIATQGRAGFYEGEVAQDMVDTLRAAGGSHRLEDFANTKCDYVTPISTVYKGHTLTELPPNGHGATALLMANILSHFDLASLAPLGAERIHLEAEAAKLAYDMRDRFIADPASNQRLEQFLSADTAAQLAAMIDPAKALHLPNERLEAVHKETVYLTVVDKDRMALSLIYSIFHSFGSGLASERFGILLQNRGAGFTLAEGHPNEAMAGRRPMHTIIPAMLEKPGEFMMPFGVMGGQYQPNGHMHFMSNIADYGMDVQGAIDAPRSFAQGGELALERGHGEALRRRLAGLGHNLITPETAIGGAQAIRIDALSGLLTGGSDPRKDGCALGY